MLKKSFPRGSQAGASTVAHKQLGAEFGFQVLDTCTDRGLGYVKAFGRFEKTAMCGDGEEGFRLIYVHFGATPYLILKTTISINDKYRLPSIILHQ